MSFTMDIYNLLIRYAKDYQGKTVTLAEIQEQAWWKCVWGWWRAKAYYKMDGYYERLEDVPGGLKKYTIINDKLKTEYFEGGHTQLFDLEMCKKVYG